MLQNQESQYLPNSDACTLKHRSLKVFEKESALKQQVFNELEEEEDQIINEGEIQEGDEKRVKIRVSAQTDCQQYSFSIDMLRIKCREKMNFSKRIEAVDKIQNSKIKEKVVLLQGIKDQLEERVQNEQTFRHLMRKRKAKHHKQHSTQLTKTTAACSIASTINPAAQKENINQNNIDYSPINNFQYLNNNLPVFGAEFGIPPSNSSSRSQSIMNYSQCTTSNKPELSKKAMIQLCIQNAQMVKELESKLIPFKNERNKISENLEDIKDDLIVSKEYLKDIQKVMESKSLYCQQLMGRINYLSRSGLQMQNRENMTSQYSALNSTRMNMNASFVDDAVSKFKQVKEFFKIKMFNNNNSSPNSNTTMNNNILGNISGIYSPQSQSVRGAQNISPNPTNGNSIAMNQTRVNEFNF